MIGPLYIVSDNHFMMKNNTSEKNRRNKLFQVFKKIKKNGSGTLIIGGDFFDFWFETNHAVPKGYESLLIELTALVQSGITVHYIAGNHDFWDFGYLSNKTGLIFHKNDLKFSYDNKNILITHGDGLLKRDFGYRFMKKIIRHKLFIDLFKLIPEKISFNFANKMSKSSSDYNHNDKYASEIKRDMLEYSKNKWEEEKIDIVMIGHYHQQEIIKENNNQLIFLGDWLQKFTVTVLNKNDIWQGNWEQFLKLT